MQNKIPKKEDLVHGSRITCEIDGVKIEDAMIAVSKYNNVYLMQNSMDGYEDEVLFGYKFSWAVEDEDIVSDKYKIRLVEEQEDTNNICKNCKGIKRASLEMLMDVSNNRKFCYCKEEPHQQHPYRDLEVEGMTDTEVITVKRWGAILKNGNLSLIMSDTRNETVLEHGQSITPIELTISYSIPKPETISLADAEKLLGKKIKII